MTTMTVDEIREYIVKKIFSELLDEAIGSSSLFKFQAITSGKNWFAKGYSLVDRVPITQFSGDLAHELYLGHVTTHREITIQGGNCQIDLRASNTLDAEGSSKNNYRVNVDISPSSDLGVLDEINNAVEEIIENLRWSVMQKPIDTISETC